MPLELLPGCNHSNGARTAYCCLDMSLWKCQLLSQERAMQGVTLLLTWARTNQLSRLTFILMLIVCSCSATNMTRNASTYSCLLVNTIKLLLPESCRKGLLRKWPSQHQASTSAEIKFLDHGIFNLQPSCCALRVEH